MSGQRALVTATDAICRAITLVDLAKISRYSLCENRLTVANAVSRIDVSRKYRRSSSTAEHRFRKAGVVSSNLTFGFFPVYQNRAAADNSGVHFLVQWLGAALVLVALIDVFLTVLYARSGVGLISRWLIPGTWKIFRALFG